mmetsp:Transcript_131760/g.381048  ORF Transcript_131760/g.381048 Transcript_131760/m.381048 type:complete len:300 (+) Transcript_131760:68-967(+)
MALVTARNLAGRVLAIVTPVPKTVGALKGELEKLLGTSVAHQSLVPQGSTQVLNDRDMVGPYGGDFVLIVDERPMFTWSDTLDFGDAFEGGWGDHPCVQGRHFKCPDACTNRINVFTRDPIRQGTHYFEFHMHYTGYEQWCGVATDPVRHYNPQWGASNVHSWAYYSRGWGSTSLAALHFDGSAVVPFKYVPTYGDIIGMLVDMTRGGIAFNLNGILQATSAIETEKPLWVFARVPNTRIHIELKKPSLQDAPPTTVQALNGAPIEPDMDKRSVDSDGSDYPGYEFHFDDGISFEEFGF